MLHDCSQQKIKLTPQAMFCFYGQFDSYSVDFNSIIFSYDFLW